MSSSEIKFGLLGAMPEEVALMERSVTVRATHSAGMRTFFEGTWHGCDVVLAHSRIGKVSAAVTAMLMIERFEVTHMIFTGVAGAIDPGLRIGDIVVADRLVHHDLDASPIPVFQRFEVPLLGKVFFETDAALTARVEHAARSFASDGLAKIVPAPVRESFGVGTPRVVRGLVASGDQFIADPAHVAALGRDLPGCLCAEMEGAAVAQVCHEMGGVPFALARVISDQADHGAAVDFQRFVNEIAEHLTGGVVAHVLESFTQPYQP